MRVGEMRVGEMRVGEIGVRVLYIVPIDLTIGVLYKFCIFILNTQNNIRIKLILVILISFIIQEQLKYYISIKYITI